MLLVLASACGATEAAPLCEHAPEAAPGLERLRAAIEHGRFVAYQPTSLQVINGQVVSANETSIRADLIVLRRQFDSLITYDAVHGAQAIATIAATLRFRALIIGVWNPMNDAEVEAALAAAQRFPDLVVGISLGNETLFSHRADFPGLAAAVDRIRKRAPRVPLSTTEPFHIFEAAEAPALLEQLDFLLPIVHPVFQPWFRTGTDQMAAQFVVNITQQMAERFCGPVLVKETGEPTAPAAEGFSEARQADFYAALRRLLAPQPTRGFAYFAAFDAPWREQDATGVPGPHPSEAHWGLFDADRHPKPAMDQLPPLAQDH